MSAATTDAPSSADLAIGFIREAIIDGTLPPESMVSEGDLASQLGVSRTPVRTALARLQDEGWVRIYPKRGALVRSLTDDEIADLQDARIVLETSGVSRASTAVRTRLADELAASIQDQRDALASGEVARFIELTIDFHAAFLAVGANRYLIDLGARLADRQRQRLFAHQDALRARTALIIDEHQDLLDCLRADDPARFATVLRAHVTETHDTPA